MTSKPATKVSSAVFSLEYSDVFGFDTVKCNYAMNGGEVTASYGEASGKLPVVLGMYGIYLISIKEKNGRTLSFEIQHDVIEVKHYR